MSERHDNQGPAVVISGASTGIGRACALKLDGLGWRVFAGVRRHDDGRALQAEASERLVPVLLDVTDAETIAGTRSTVAEAVSDRGLAGLVNNAGIAVAAPIEFVPLEEFRRQFEVNVTGQVAVIQAFLPLLRQARGRIVNMSSMGGRASSPFIGPYCSSKFALEALSDALRLELRPWDIQVAVIEPGEIATPIWEKSLAAANQLIARLPPRALELYGPVIDAMRRMAANAGGLPADVVADAVVHALTASRPKARYLIGRDAKTRMIIERLPTRWRDGLIASRLPGYG